MWYFLPVYCSLGANLPPPPDLISIGEYFGKCCFFGKYQWGKFYSKKCKCRYFFPQKSANFEFLFPQKSVKCKFFHNITPTRAKINHLGRIFTYAN